MFDNQVDFDRRVRKLNRKHAALSKGYTTLLRKDGLIVVKPQSAPIRFPYKFFLMLVAGVLLFKAVLLANIGELDYNNRVAALASGTTVERMGAAVMQTEPATRYLASWMAPYLD